MSGLADNLQNSLLDRLDRAYPSFNGAWRVHVDDVGGIVQVTNIMLSNRWGFLMHITNIDPEGRNVVRNAGELLERYNVSRAMKVDLDTIFNMPRNRRGDLSAFHG